MEKQETELSVKRAETISYEQKSFYIYLRPVAIMSKLLGTFPIKRATGKDGKSLRFKFTSFDMLWDIIVFAAVAYLFNSYNYSFKVQSFYSSFPQIWMEVIVIKSTIRSGVQFLLWHYRSPAMSELIKEFETMHERYRLVNEKCLRFYQVVITIATFIVCTGLAAAAYFNFEPYGTSNISTIFVIFAYAVLNMSISLPMAIFTFLCMVLVASFRQLNANVKQLLTSSCGKTADTSYETLENARLQHVHLSNLVNQIEKCYGYQLLSNVGFLVLDSVVHLFIFLIVSGCTAWALFLLVAYDVGLALFIFITTQFLVDTAHAVLEDLKSVPLSKLSANAQAQVHIFMSQIMADPIQISAAGYFVVGKTQITSILSSVATYLIVMIQFSPYIQDGTFIQGLSKNK